MKLVLTLGLVGCLTTALSAQIVVNPTSLNLGTVDRGSGAASSVKVTNGFPEQTTFTASFSTQSGTFSVSANSSFSLASNQQKTIPINIEAGASPGNYSGTFTIQGGGASVTVPVTATVIDAFATTFSPSLLDFGNVILGQSKPLSLNITNTSPGSLTYSGTANPSLYTVSPSSLPLSSSQSGTLTVTFSPGSNVGNFPGVVNVKANNSIVGSSNLKAFGAVPPGSIQVAPATLDFGNVDQAAGAASSYTLTNGSAGTLSFTFARTGNFVTPTSSVSLGAGLSKTIAVNVEAGAGPGLLTGSVSITGGGQSAAVALKANVLESPKPDLTIAFISTTPTLSTTRVGQLATFNLRVETGGVPINSSFAVKTFLDNALVKTTTVSVTQLASFNVGFVLPPNTTGSHNVRVQVDANNQILETNENNNATTVAVNF